MLVGYLRDMHQTLNALRDRLSVDELPQLFNVIKGEMSLVGPRPPIPYEVELYEDWMKKRFDTIPVVFISRGAY